MDFGTDRDLSNFEADFDSRHITITMFPVSEREDRTFKAGRAEWGVVESIYRQFAAEMEYESNPPVLGDSGDVWLVTAPNIFRPYSLVCGAAEVDADQTVPILSWIWVHPLQRGNRSDSAKQLWERLKTEYDQIVPGPSISPAMKKFLKKHGHEEK